MRRISLGYVIFRSNAVHRNALPHLKYCTLIFLVHVLFFILPVMFSILEYQSIVNHALTFQSVSNYTNEVTKYPFCKVTSFSNPLQLIAAEAILLRSHPTSLHVSTSIIYACIGNHMSSACFSFALASESLPATLNTLQPRQNSRPFPNDIFKCIFVTENLGNSIKISLWFVP